MEGGGEKNEPQFYNEDTYAFGASIPLTLVSSLLKSVKHVSKKTKVSVPKILVTTLKASKMKHAPFISSKPHKDQRVVPETNFLLNELLMRCNIACMGSIYTADIVDGHIYAPSGAEIMTFMIVNGKTSHYGSRLPKSITNLNNRAFMYGLDENDIKNKKDNIIRISKGKPFVKRNILKTVKYANIEEEQLLDALREYVPIKYKKSRDCIVKIDKKTEKYSSKEDCDELVKHLPTDFSEEGNFVSSVKKKKSVLTKYSKKKCKDIYPDINIELKAIVIPIRPPQTCWISLECIPKRMLKKTRDDEIEKMDKSLPKDYKPPVSKPTFIIALRGSRMWYDWAIDGIVEPVPFPPNKDASQENHSYMAHKGMANAALHLANALIPILKGYSEGLHNNKLRDSVIAENPNGNVWNVIITGHSYGAGVATLVAPLLRPMFPKLNVTAIGYATPACMSIDLSRAVKDYVTTVIFETDIVPRLGVYPISLMLRNYIDYKKGKKSLETVVDMNPDVVERNINENENENDISSENNNNDDLKSCPEKIIEKSDFNEKHRDFISIHDERSLVASGRILSFRFCTPGKDFVHSFPEYKKKKASMKDEKPRKFVYNPNKDYNLRLIDSTEELHNIEFIPHKFGTVNHDLSNYLRGFENIRIAIKDDETN